MKQANLIRCNLRKGSLPDKSKLNPEVYRFKKVTPLQMRREGLEEWAEEDYLREAEGQRQRDRESMPRPDL